MFGPNLAACQLATWAENAIKFKSVVSRAVLKQYTDLGSQTQTPKCLKVLISGVSFCQHSLLQSQESDVLSYSECKIAKNFQVFAPGPYWGGLRVWRRLPGCTMVFLLITLVEKPAPPPKYCWIWHCKLKLSKKWKRKSNKNEVGMELETKCWEFYTYFS